MVPARLQSLRFELRHPELEEALRATVAGRPDRSRVTFVDMPEREDPWGHAGESTRAEVRDIFARAAASGPAGLPAELERRRPLPGLLGLPKRAWIGLPPVWRGVVAVLGVLALVGLAIAVPAAVRHGNEVADAARAADARAKAERRRELIEDQRPRSAPIGAESLRAVRRLGGLTSPAAAALLGRQLENGITADVQSRIRAGLLEGPARATECQPVRDRAPGWAGYNCFTLSDRREFRDQPWRQLSVGYRFTAKATLAPALLVWCKENPPPLHPTSVVVKVPQSTRCR